MGLSNRRNPFTYSLLIFFQYALGSATTVWGATLKTNPAKFPTSIQPFAPYILYAQENAWWGIPVSMLFLGAIQVFKKSHGNPIIWNSVHGILNDFRDKVFPNQPAEHEHRVTLFRHYDSYFCLRTLLTRFPWSGCLVPVVRSGEVTQNPHVIFNAPPDTPNKSTGVAGLTWESRECQHISNLPDLDTTSAERRIHSYASKTKSSPANIAKKVKKGKILARSFYGIPVEVKGKTWGVIILDSRNPQIPNAEGIKQLYRNLAIPLERLLENA